MPQLRFFYAAESRGDSQFVTRFGSPRSRDAYVAAHCPDAWRITAAEASTLLKQRAATPLIRR
jgi:hypothetical protein